MNKRKRVKVQHEENEKNTEEVKKVVKKKAQNKVVCKKSVPVKKKQKMKRKQYSKLELEKAVNAVNLRGMSVREAAAKFNVPSTSIHRAAKNPEKSYSRPGPSQVLPPRMEDEIVNWILYRAETGSPVTKVELLDSVQKYVKSLGDQISTPFTNGRPGRHWFEKFRARHPQITIRTPQHLSMSRASVTEEDLRDWFCEIKTYLKSKNLDNIHPSRVFNCDETNIQFIPKSEKILTEKGTSTAYKIVDGNEKESLTVLFMYSADGTRAPPMLMFKYADKVPLSIINNCPEGWGIGNSENGWMTTETFYEYITNVFYPWLVEQNVEFPVILYVDGHSSHVTIPLVSFCREKQIELICLFPNATHIIQPLDIAFFHPFKEIWRAAIMKYKAENNISRLKKEHVAAVLKLALESFKNEKTTIQNGFKAAGLMPLNADAVEYNVLQKKKKGKKENESCQPEKFSQAEESMDQHLTTLEKNLSPNLVKSFEEAEMTGILSEDVENNTSLFEYWLRIKKAVCDRGADSRPLIKSNISLTNHKVIVLPPHPIPSSTPVDCIHESGLNVSNDPIVIEVADDIQENELNDLIGTDGVPSTESNNTNDLDCILSEDMLLKSFGNLPPEIEKVNHYGTQESIDEIANKQNSEKIVQNNTQDEQIMSDQNENDLSILKENVQKSSEKIITDLDNSEDSDKIEKENSLPQNDNDMDMSDASVQRTLKNIKEEANKTGVKKKTVPKTSKNSDSPVEKKSFADAFTLPIQYLPQKKRVKLAATGKPKLPSVGTSEEWWKMQMEKEQALKLKAEQAAKKKLLQEEKRKLVEEKKKYLLEMKEKLDEIQNKIST